MPEGRLTLAAVAIALAVVFAASARRDRRIAARRAWLAAVGACVAAAAWLGATALVLRPESGVEYFEGDRPVRLHAADADLGCVPRAGASVRTQRRSDGVVLFDARYSIGNDGWRITPGDPAGPPIVFFGCSFTFGQGVGDDETLPARVSAALGGTAHVESRAAPGYGPHQMLRLLETGRAAIAPGTRVLYQALGDHVRRAAGKTPWDDAGPRYVLDGDGVRFAGPLHARCSARSHPGPELYRLLGAAIAARLASPSAPPTATASRG